MKQIYENHIIEYENEVKKSLFITLVKKVTSENEAKDFIATHRKNDANHNCFAYIHGDNQQIQRKNDDGEPLNSARKTDVKHFTA